MIDDGRLDRTGRRITLRPVDDSNWRAVADVAPRDEQRRYVAALGARYLLLSMREGVWTSLAVCADDTVVGHVMWGVDDDGSRWIGGMLIDAAEQGKGVGRAALRTLSAWLAAQPECTAVRLSYHPDNAEAGALYQSEGFRLTGETSEDEVVAQLEHPRPRQP